MSHSNSSGLDHSKFTYNNNDITNELIMSKDLAVDLNKDNYLRASAAKTIQRWWKNVIEKKLMREAEEIIAQTRKLNKFKKEKLVKTYVEGRDSVDVNQYWDWKNEGQKENFSVFAQSNNMVRTETPIEKKPLKQTDSKETLESHRKETESKQQAKNDIQILDDISDYSKMQKKNSIKPKIDLQEEDEDDNKLKALNDLLKKKEFQIQ